jgi:dihydroxyacetone kinase-like protein
MVEVGVDGFDEPAAVAWVTRVAASVREHEAELTGLDAAIGDGDHGANMRRGFDAAVAAIGQPDASRSPGGVLTRTGTTLISKVGGAAGPLLGSAFRALGKAIDGSGSAEEPARSVDAAVLGAGLRAALEAIQRLGGAQVGDKTMVDAYAPAFESFQAAAGEGLAEAARRAAAAANDGAESAIPLRARKGRASYLGDRSKNHADPGAASAVLIMRALADVLAE